MYYLVELYSPRTSWLALSYEERLGFFQKIQAGMTGLDDAEIEIVAMGKIDAQKSQAASQDFFAIWRMPEESSLDTLIESIRSVGWHDFFETVNVPGRAGKLPGHLQDLAVL